MYVYSIEQLKSLISKALNRSWNVCIPLFWSIIFFSCFRNNMRWFCLSSSLGRIFNTLSCCSFTWIDLKASCVYNPNALNGSVEFNILFVTTYFVSRQPVKEIQHQTPGLLKNLIQRRNEELVYVFRGSIFRCHNL